MSIELDRVLTPSQQNSKSMVDLTQLVVIVIVVVFNQMPNNLINGSLLEDLNEEQGH